MRISDWSSDVCSSDLQACTRRAVLNLLNARHRDDPRPLDPDCPCPTCADYSRAYLHHLFKAKEMLAPILLSRHNLHHYQQLMAGLRDAIAAGRLDVYVAVFDGPEATGALAAPRTSARSFLALRRIEGGSLRRCVGAVLGRPRAIDRQHNKDNQGENE